jgi:hypothetical protein
MSEDSGKKSHVRDFLRRVSRGLGLVEDIWIDRAVKKPGSDGNFNEANSLSCREISSISSLLKDDLRCIFEDSSFVFRFIAASPGSGKTATIEYFQKLIETDISHANHSVVINFSLNEMLSILENNEFGVKFYSHILVQTFWRLIGSKSSQLSPELIDISNKFLEEVFGRSELAQLTSSSNSPLKFTTTFTDYLNKHRGSLRDFFFYVIDYFSQRCPQASFIYLIDELDALQSRPNYTNDARSIIRDLFNKSANLSKIRLLVYMVGRADDVNSFINEEQDSALYSRVHLSVINLVKFRVDECDQIRKKLEETFAGAYSGFKGYEQARKEIASIALTPGKDYSTLREFCQKIASEFIKIHDKYFLEESFNQFERNARSRLKSESMKMWKDYLGENCTAVGSFKLDHCGHDKWEKIKGKGGYELVVSQTTTVIKNHAVDCYAELWHNEHVVAKAYGEAKNYNLIKEHIDTFHEWLNDFEFYRQSTKTPRNLAFFIAPGCSDLQRRKIELKYITFIEEQKIIESPTIGNDEPNSPVNINTADQTAITKALKGTKIKGNTINKLISDRAKQKYRDLDDFVARMRWSGEVRQRIQTKMDDGSISIL